MFIIISNIIYESYENSAVTLYCKYYIIRIKDQISLLELVREES